MGIAYFPFPKAEETVYSICARYHSETGATSPSATSLKLFASPTVPQYCDVPVCLDYLERSSGGVIPNSEQTIRDRSGLAPYLTVMSTRARSEFLRAAASGSPSETRARSGLNRYVGSDRLLKFCPVCLEEQMASEGVGWWIASHQCPGIWFCDKHRKLLAWVPIGLREAKQWLLPHMCSELALQQNLNVSTQLKLLRVSSVMKWIAQCRRLDTSLLQVMMKNRLRAASYCRSEVKLRHCELDLLVMRAREHYAPALLPDLLKANNQSWLKLVLGDPRHYDPLTWSLGIAWQGDVAEAALTSEYMDAQARKPEGDLFDQLSRKSRRVTAPFRVYRAFENATYKRDVIRETGLSAAEIDGWLRRDPMLKATWQSAHRERVGNECAAQIQEFVRSGNHLRRVDVLNNCTRAYRWLEENDAQALQRLLPAPLAKYDRQLRLDLD